MKAIGYVRVSTEKQADFGVSLETQTAKIRAMAVVQGAELVEVHARRVAQFERLRGFPGSHGNCHAAIGPSRYTRNPASLTASALGDYKTGCHVESVQRYARSAADSCYAEQEMFMTRALLATALVATFTTTALHAQSLADVAKKAEEQRAKARQEQSKSEDTKGTDKPSATKVFTNKDLVDVPSPPAAAPAETKTESAAKDTSNKTATEKPNEPAVKDETYWKGRMLVLRQNLDRDRGACPPLATKVRTLENALAATQTTMVQGNQIVPAEFAAPAAAVRTKLADAVTELGQCTAKVKTDQQAVTDLEEEGRRAGALPGWLR